MLLMHVVLPNWNMAYWYENGFTELHKNFLWHTMHWNPRSVAAPSSRPLPPAIPLGPKDTWNFPKLKT
jgi:hypothetical protein